MRSDELVSKVLSIHLQCQKNHSYAYVIYKTLHVFENAFPKTLLNEVSVTNFCFIFLHFSGNIFKELHKYTKVF